MVSYKDADYLPSPAYYQLGAFSYRVRLGI